MSKSFPKWIGNLITIVVLLVGCIAAFVRLEVKVEAQGDVLACTEVRSIKNKDDVIGIKKDITYIKERVIKQEKVFDEFKQDIKEEFKDLAELIKNNN